VAVAPSENQTYLAGDDQLDMTCLKLNYATPRVTLALLRPPAIASSMSLEEFLLIRPNSGPALLINHKFRLISCIFYMLFSVADPDPDGSGSD
jgi:hypothetical protein